MRPKNSSTNLRATCVAQHSLGGRVEGADVRARASAAARRCPRSAPTARARARSPAARRQHVLDRARDVDRRRGVDPLRRRVEQQLADARAPAPPPSGSNRSSGVSRARPDQLARLAHQLRRPARGEQQRRGAARSASSRETSAANVPTSFAILDRMRRDLGDGEALCTDREAMDAVAVGPEGGRGAVGHADRGEDLGHVRLHGLLR